MHARAIPPNFCLVKRGAATLILRRSLSEELLRLGVENPWQWVKTEDPSLRFYSGRIDVAALTLPVNGGLPVVLRRYHHGGIFGWLQKDRYLFSFSPLRELAASHYAQQRGIPVPEILAAVHQRSGLFCRVDLLMRHLPGGWDLGDYFLKRYSPTLWREKKEIIRGVGRLVRQMHEAGLYHADLHLKNIFMAENDGVRNLYLLDLDKSQIVPRLSESDRRKNLLRFHRYLEKYFGDKKFFTRADRVEFLKSYFGNAPEAEEYARRYGKKFEEHVRRHRFLWRKLGGKPGWFAYGFLRAVIGAINLLPERAAFATARLIGRTLFPLSARLRRKALANLKIAFGATHSKEEREAIARRHFGHVALLAIEFLRTFKLRKEALDRFYARQEVVGIEHLQEGLRRGKGILLLISHFGNWEIMSLVARHIGMPLHALAKPIKNRWIDAWVNRVRRRLGVRVIKAARLNRAILRALAQNHAVAMLFDQNAGRHGEMISFFGKPALTTTAPAYFALKSGAAVIAAYAVRQSGGRFKIVIEPPVNLVKKDDFREAIRANMELFSQDLEKFVRQYPEQWWWLHRRWRGSPPS